MIEILQAIITVLCSVIASSSFWLFIEKKSNKKDLSSKMLIGLAHERIVSLGMEYIKKGVIFMSNKVYDVLKWIAMYLLPALGTLYFALASIWGLPYGEQIVGTITAIDTFLGVILGISSAKYNKML